MYRCNLEGAEMAERGVRRGLGFLVRKEMTSGSHLSAREKKGKGHARTGSERSGPWAASREREERRENGLGWLGRSFFLFTLIFFLFYFYLTELKSVFKNLF